MASDGFHFSTPFCSHPKNKNWKRKKTTHFVLWATDGWRENRSASTIVSNHCHPHWCSWSVRLSKVAEHRWKDHGRNKQKPTPTGKLESHKNFLLSTKTDIHTSYSLAIPVLDICLRNVLTCSTKGMFKEALRSIAQSSPIRDTTQVFVKTRRDRWICGISSQWNSMQEREGKS